MSHAASQQHEENPQLARLLDYCRALAGQHALPLADDFRPRDVRWALGWISLIDVLDRGADFRFRLFGTMCQSVYGLDLTGKKLSEIERCGTFTGLRGNYEEVVNLRRPALKFVTFLWANGSEIGFERLLMPFVDREDEVCRILIAADCGMAEQDAIIVRGIGLPTMIQSGTSLLT